MLLASEKAGPHKYGRHAWIQCRVATYSRALLRWFVLYSYCIVRRNCRVLSVFGLGRFLDVSLVCIGHLRLCARQLAEGGVDVALQVSQTKEPALLIFWDVPLPSPVMLLFFVGERSGDGVTALPQQSVDEVGDTLLPEQP